MMKYLIIFCFITINIFPQSTRSLINEGVELYNKKEYIDSEVNFLKGLEKAPDSFEAKFNLGDVYYKQEKYDEAIKTFNSALSQTDDNNLKAKVHYNIGNSLLKSKKIKESIEAYKNSLKLNPDDAEAKYNLSYALSLLEQEQENQQNKDQNKDQDKQDQQDQNNQQDQNQQDQNQDQQQNKQQNKSGEDQQAQQDNLKQPENEISKEEAQRILEALKNNEKDLQKKLRRQQGTPVKTEKDW